MLVIPSPDSYLETLIQEVMVFEDEVFRRSFGHEGGAPLVGLVFSREEVRGQFTLFLPHERLWRLHTPLRGHAQQETHFLKSHAANSIFFSPYKKI